MFGGQRRDARGFDGVETVGRAVEGRVHLRIGVAEEHEVVRAQLRLHVPRNRNGAEDAALVQGFQTLRQLCCELLQPGGSPIRLFRKQLFNPVDLRLYAAEHLL